MNKTEKYIILVIVFSAICGLVLKITGNILEYNFKYHWAFIISYFSLIGLNVYYLIKLKPPIIKLIFFLLIITTYSHISRVMHWPGTAFFLIFGWIPYIFITGVLINNCLQQINKNSNLVIFFLIISLILVAQFILQFTAYALISWMLNYVLIATILILKFRVVNIKTEENKILNVLVLLAMYQLIVDIIQLL